MRAAALLFAPLLAVSAPQVPDAAGLLARNAKALGNFSTVQIKTDVSMEMAVMGTPSSVSYTMSIEVARPAKFRMDVGDSFTTISDGANTWMYIPMLKKYSKKTTSSADLHEEMDSLLEVSDSDPQVLANAKVVRSEVLEVDGQPRDCWVVESRVAKEAVPKPAGAEMEDAVHSFWIDKQLGLMLQTAVSGKMHAGPVATDMKMKFTTRSIQLNQPLADSLFTFTPPADAREVAESELMPGILGEPAAKGMEPVSPDALAALPVPPPPETAGASTPGEPVAFVPNLHTLEYVTPVYPAEARDKGLGGEVELLVTIDPAGRVVNVEALSGRTILRQPAIDAVRQERFRPVMRSGRPVYAYTTESVSFMEPMVLGGKEPPKDVSPIDTGLDSSDEMASVGRTMELMEKFPRTPEQVLADLEQDLGGTQGIERVATLPELATAAIDAGAIEKARSYATELLTHAGAGHFTDGDSLYTGNMVLGLLALHDGNVEQAKHYLLESAKTKGSPVLGSFGPDFRLARALVQKGEREVVLQFLDLCRAFWKMGAEKLDAMIATVRSGGTI